MDLSKLSVADLRALQEQVAHALKEREQQERAQARAQILAIAQSAGIPLKELMATSSLRPKTGAVAVRYRHPKKHLAAMDWPRPPAEMGAGMGSVRAVAGRAARIVIVDGLRLLAAARSC